MNNVVLSEWQVRAARPDDLAAMQRLAAKTGGGFTNLPDDREALAARLSWSERSFAASIDAPENELYLLMLEHRPTGRVGGTAAIFSRVGVNWPFYSYKLTQLSMHSEELGRTFRTRVLHLVNDFDGASEVGGLFLEPDLRTGGLGRMLARSRYLFIALHRQRFADRVLAELRGRIEADGGSHFWDGLAGRFFGMSFQEADAFNSTHGNQFIADLMPKYPVYVDLLPEAAQAVLGEVHVDGVAAQRMLVAEGFQHNGYVDIFDGGPTMDVKTSDIRTLREAVHDRVAGFGAGAEPRLMAAGRLADFRAAVLSLRQSDRGVIVGQGPFAEGEEILHVHF